MTVLLLIVSELLVTDAFMLIKNERSHGYNLPSYNREITTNI